jgi:hypothetical protein
VAIAAAPSRHSSWLIRPRDPNAMALGCCHNRQELQACYLPWYTSNRRSIVTYQNIQIAELNALNATLAVIKWNKLRGFYRDEDCEHYSVYRLDSNTIINDDTLESTV